MKTVVLLYPTSCIYEIVILNYFLHFAGKEVLFVSPDGTPITAMEGYSINVSGKLTDIAPDEIELAIVPGGNIKAIDNPIVWNCLKDIKSRGGILAAICAGVDVLDHAGILDGVVSTHSSDLDVAVTDQVITSRANGYVDFAIEVAKKMNLFQDEADLQETTTGGCSNSGSLFLRYQYFSTYSATSFSGIENSFPIVSMIASLLI